MAATTAGEVTSTIKPSAMEDRNLLVDWIRIEGHFDAATRTNPQRGRIMVCTPTAGAEAACARTIVTRFGRRAWRRPLTSAEVELERRIVSTTGGATCATPPRPMDGLAYAEAVRVMNQLMAMALRCDVTRVITFMLGNAGSGRDYTFLGAAGAHHELGHHQSDAEKLRKLQVIGTWEVE